MGSYSLAEGERLVKAARQAIELSILSPRFSRRMVKDYTEGFERKEGVLVAIMHYPTMEPRGRYGIFDLITPLSESVTTAALAAANKDPEHIPISHLEFEHMLVQVSILESRERLMPKKAEALRREIRTGRRGLMVRSGFHSAILPPPELTKEKNAEKLLSSLCARAGLPEYSWKHSNTELYSFEIQTFREILPGNSVEEITL